jgi:hypothetical protein
MLVAARLADDIYIEEIGRTGLLRRHLAGLRRDPAGEDRRRDGRRAHLRLRHGLRTLASTDGMTADFYPST